MKPDRALNTIYNESENITRGKGKRERAEQAELLKLFENAGPSVSQRDFERLTGIPRSTLRYWLSRKDEIDASAPLIEFFESPDGIAFIHRMLTAAHFVFTKVGTASIHNVSEFLHLCGLSPFIASSYSTQCRISKQMDENLVLFGAAEKDRLCNEMPPKKITLCEDETFHPEICLVAIEPTSNFILVERYAVNRESATWNDAVSDALNNLPVEVIQVAGDEGRSLICHALKGLNVHHSPDCFHVIYEIGKGTCGALMAKVKKAEKEHEKAIKNTNKIECEREKYDSAEKRARGRRPHFEKRIEQAHQKERQTEEKLEKARINHDVVKNAKAEIGDVYHPYNLKTGQIQDSKTVSNLLTGCFEKIHNATNDLSDRCKKRVNKAQRVVNSMVATIEFFFQLIDIYMDNMQLSECDRHLMQNYLIPGYYLELAASKERDVDRKADIFEKAQELLSVAESKGTSHHCSVSQMNKLKDAAKDCAQFFQRSSSCVEGRNAQLALRHQGIHRLSDQHLNALTVVHNYYIKRRDGTTAAERFFENKPNDLFEFLLNNMDYPARPRKHLKIAA